MNWRAWIFPKLQAASLSVPASSVFAGGSLTGAPASRPFIIYRLQGTDPLLRDDMDAVSSSTFAEVWVYDEPGSYDRIDAILTDVVASLSGAVASPGAVACQWQGNSPELSDDDLKAITRNATFRLIGATS